VTPRSSIVTGGARGIGGAISLRLAARGDHVVLNDVDETAAREARTRIEAGGGTCTVVPGDITDADVVRATVEAAAGASGGQVDVLVNNVGDFRPASRDFAHSTPEQWQRLYELNLRHVLDVTHAVLPHLAPGSTIVNLSTVEAYRGIPGHAVYSAFNAGVSAFTKSLAVELGPRGIRVNAIAPDLADTDQTPASAMLRGRDPGLVESWVPLGRFGQPDDYAAVVEFLTTDAARFVTGQTIPVDGGTLAASGWYRRTDGKGWTNMPDRP
jgi:2-hydroxycyclohexanecarboxyl-CoA dehydrogenase